MHPLIDDLDEFTDSQLQEKVVTLKKRYFSTMNGDKKEKED
mgnify:CR=1 FL=1